MDHLDKAGTLFTDFLSLLEASPSKKRDPYYSAVTNIGDRRSGEE